MAHHTGADPPRFHFVLAAGPVRLWFGTAFEPWRKLYPSEGDPLHRGADSRLSRTPARIVECFRRRFSGPSFFRDKRITTAVRISRDSAQGSNGARPAILFYFNMRGFLVMKLSSILKGLLITCSGVSQVLLIAPPGRLSSCESSAVQPLPPTTLHRSACSVLWLHPCNKMELSRTFQRLIRLY